MQLHGVMVTDLQCENKWKGMLRSYKSVKDHNKQTGRGRRTLPYFNDLDEMLGESPNITPAAVECSTIPSTIEDSTIIPPSMQTTPRSSTPINRGKKSQRSVVEEYIKHSCQMNEAKERRHNELMQALARQSDLLEQLIQKQQ